MSWEDDARRVAEIFGVPAGHRLPRLGRPYDTIIPI